MSTLRPAACSAPAFLIVACAAIAATVPTHAQTVRDLWIDQCIRCHGDRGQGGMASSLLTPDGVLTDGSDEAFFKAIKDGMELEGMPAYDEALSDAEMWALVVYIRELQHRDAREQGAGPERDEQGIYRTQHHNFSVELAHRGALNTPWAVGWFPDGRMIVTERPGRMRIIELDGSWNIVQGTPEVYARGQGGMLDVAVHPDDDNNPWVYLAYSDPRGRNSMTKVVRARIENDQWTDQQTIFEAPEDTYVRTAFHFGCKLVFDDDYLYLCIGDRGIMDHAQLLERPSGKVHRVHHDGSIPSDNPFVDREGALPTIWSYGHRNPQGMSLDTQGNLWVTEHGPRGGDELNLVKKAANYGWPSVSFGINYNGTPFRTPWPEENTGITQPVFVWTPSIAASGLDVMRSDDAFPQWQGDLFAGGLAGQTVRRLRVRDGELIEREEILFDRGRVRDVRVGPDGMVYVVLNDPDTVVRLRPADE